jgi:Flp pilus assembly pilin Flp
MNVRERLEQLSALWADERGQDVVEYALLAGLVAVASGLFAPEMTDGMKTIYSRLASRLEQAVE